MTISRQRAMRQPCYAAMLIERRDTRHEFATTLP